MRNIFKHQNFYWTSCSMIWVFVLASFISYGQDTSNTIGRVSIASPTAASLGKFGDIPVSYHTGIPQIDVPIYTIQSGSLKLPVSLSYHASGLKVQENASWVGAGWALNAGGMITRSVVGGPDDRGLNGSIVTNGYYRDYGFQSYLNQNPDNTGVPDVAGFSQGRKDGEPDLYFFNFGTYSGKFYFNDDRTPILVPEADFKIETYLSPGFGFKGFIIRTPDGVKYYFGQTGNYSGPDPIETTVPSTSQNGTASATAAASSWFLNKIMSADGMDSITLSYQTESYSYYTVSMFPIANNNYNPTSSDPKNLGSDLVKNFVSGVRLSQINFANGKVVFTKSAALRSDVSGGTLVNSSLYESANNSSYALGSISISNNGGFCKKDSFYYGYFYDASPITSNFAVAWNNYGMHSDQYRLRLDSIQESSCDASIKIPPYKFTYFQEAVPRKLSFGVDHWGFANGVNTNKFLIPTVTVNTSGYDSVTVGANRDAAWPAMRGGSLQQITYPTGGFTSFDFEPKDVDTFYTQVLQQTQLAYLNTYYHNTDLTQTAVIHINANEGAFYYKVDNSSTNTSPLITITNSSGQYVCYSPFYVPYNGTSSGNYLLPEGDYTITMYFSNVPSPLGSLGYFGQYRHNNVTVYQLVGGLRIKSTSSNDGITPNNITTNYNYTGSAAKGTGVLYSIPTYVQVIRNDMMALIYNDACNSNGCESCSGTSISAHTYFVSPSSIRPMASIQGENMGYNEVDVSQPGNGRSVYRYYGSNLWNLNLKDVCTRYLEQKSLCDLTIPNSPSAPIPFEYLRDELKYEGQFNEAGQLLKETYYYPSYSANPLLTPGHIGTTLPGQWSTYTEYNLQTAKKVQSKVSTTMYDPATGTSLTQTSSTYFGSPFHNLPTRQVVLTSTGDSLITMSKYAMDYRIAACDNVVPDSLVYFNSLAKSDYDTMIVHMNRFCSTNACRHDTLARYQQIFKDDRIKFINYRRRIFAVDTSSSILKCYADNLLTALPDTLLRPVLRLQTLYQNPLIEQTSWKNANLLHATFNRYDTSINPIGYAYPGRTKLINLQSPSSTFTSSSVSGSTTIIKDSRYIDETFYNFSKGNPAQVLGRSGTPIAYIWDYQNTQPIAKVDNAKSTQIAFTSFEADGKGNWNFTGTPSIDATTITGTKNYSLTSGNISASGLDNTKSYVVSYWSKTGSATVNGSSGSLLVTKNGWNYYEHIISSGTSTVTISGAVVIDELRLYPTDAQMTSYTYIPAVGLSTSCDVGSHISYYQYDALGRLKVVKDQDGNIVKTLEYHYMGQ